MSREVRMTVVLALLCIAVIAGCDAGSSAMGENRIRFEHISLNVDNSMEVGHWYRDNLGMKIIRAGDDPGSKQFVCDPGGNMMFEFYHSKSARVPDYAAMNNHEIHIAFLADDVEGACRKLVNAGARMDGEIVTTGDGDRIGVVRDPWGIPIQFVKRSKPMLYHNQANWQLLTVSISVARDFQIAVV